MPEKNNILVLSESEVSKNTDFTYECECGDCNCPDGDCCTDY